MVKSKENYFALWDQLWGFTAKDYPIIATELGWVKSDGKGAHIPVINNGSYGPQIIEFMQHRNISWVAWVFDPDWSPTMISDWSFTPTQQGAFFKEEMLKHQ
jgi:endoglucanase